VVFWIVTPCCLVGGYKRSSETLVTIYKSTLSHKPEDHNQHLHRRENFTSRYNYCYCQQIINFCKVNNGRFLIATQRFNSATSTCYCISSMNLFLSSQLTFLRSSLCLNTVLDLPSGRSVPSCFSAKMLCSFLVSPNRAICSVYHNLHFTTLK
jgi:hypothetical protein